MFGEKINAQMNVRVRNEGVRRRVFRSPADTTAVGLLARPGFGFGTSSPWP